VQSSELWLQSDRLVSLCAVAVATALMSTSIAAADPSGESELRVPPCVGIDESRITLPGFSFIGRRHIEGYELLN
jgi:hypothetical protein